MIVKFPQLADATVQRLITLSNSIEFKVASGRNQRMGVNRMQNPSVYENSRWYDWGAKARNEFKACFPELMLEHSLVGWFLKIPAEAGCLDRMEYWVGQKMAGTMLSFALQDNQEIVIDDEVYSVSKGEGIGFSVRHVHEIKPSQSGQLWACVMVLEQPEFFK